MTTEWLKRDNPNHNSVGKYQIWMPFPDHAIVQVKNIFGDSTIDIVKNLWWGYADGLELDSVIYYVRRLDKEWLTTP
jgi:hypothetical protein